MIRNKIDTLSIRMVPKSLSTGIFSTLFSAVHLDISPALGINIFVKYPTETAETELIFDDLYPKASIKTNPPESSVYIGPTSKNHRENHPSKYLLPKFFLQATEFVTNKSINN